MDDVGTCARSGKFRIEKNPFRQEKQVHGRSDSSLFWMHVRSVDLGDWAGIRLVRAFQRRQQPL
jgi:hypothetical protein